MTRFTTSHKTKLLSRALAVLFWLGAWQAVSAIVGQEILLVSPVRAVSTLIRLMGTLDFYRSVLNSFGRILAGFAIGTLGGVLLAVAALRMGLIRALVDPMMQVIKATPVASFVILALIWISSRQLSIFTGFLMVLPIVYTNVLTGLENTDPKLIEMARVFRLSFAKRAHAIYLPAAYPHFLSACELSLGMCWKAGIAAEVIGLPDRSIGMALYQAKIFLNTPELFAWTIAIILLSVGFERAVLGAVRRVRGGKKGVSRRGDSNP